jgi:hypothetical protein
VTVAQTDDGQPAETVEAWQTGPDAYSTTDLPYLPERDDRFHYAHDAVADVEQTTCGKGAGCRHAGTRAQVAEHGPGGICGLLAGIFVGEVQVEIRDDGERLSCTRYEERVVARRGSRTPPGQGVLL